MSSSAPFSHCFASPSNSCLIADDAGSGDVTIDEAKLKQIEDAVKESGLSFENASHDMGGWKGGIVWLVPTERDIEKWKPIATRTL